MRATARGAAPRCARASALEGEDAWNAGWQGPGSGAWRFVTWRFARHVAMRGLRATRFVACGLMVNVALEAAKLLESQGVKAAVVNASTIKPLDADTIEAVARKAGAVETIEEHSIIGGLGSAVCQALAERYPVPVVRMGLNDVFGQSGTAEELLVHHGLTAQAAAEKALGIKGARDETGLSQSRKAAEGF